MEQCVLNVSYVCGMVWAIVGMLVAIFAGVWACARLIWQIVEIVARLTKWRKYVKTHFPEFQEWLLNEEKEKADENMDSSEGKR